MMRLFGRLADAWIGRWANPAPDALAAVAGLQPATIVTGGSAGIGRAIAQHFAEQGHTVVLIARRADPLEATAAILRQTTSAKIVTLALDVTDAGATAALDQTLAQHGLYADVLVNSAGIGLAGEFTSHAPDDIDRLVALNVAALTRLMRHVLPGMCARARGGVINIASLGGYVPGPYQAAYYASKAYVLSLTEAAGYEIAGRGVRVLVVAPGPVETRFHALMDSEQALYRHLIPALSPERVARATCRAYALGRRVVVPGFFNPFLALAVRILPHPIIVPFIGWLLAPRREDG